MLDVCCNVHLLSHGKAEVISSAALRNCIFPLLISIHSLALESWRVIDLKHWLSFSGTNTVPLAKYFWHFLFLFQFYFCFWKTFWQHVPKIGTEHILVVIWFAYLLVNYFLVYGQLQIILWGKWFPGLYLIATENLSDLLSSHSSFVFKVDASAVLCISMLMLWQLLPWPQLIWLSITRLVGTDEHLAFILPDWRGKVHSWLKYHWVRIF